MNITPTQAETIARALKSLDADAETLRAMRRELERKPRNWRTYSREEMTTQALSDEKQIRAYRQAVRAYKAKVERVASNLT